VIRVAYTDTSRTRIRAFVASPPGRVGAVLGEAVLVATGRWSVRAPLGARPRYAYRRRSALRLLATRAGGRR